MGRDTNQFSSPQPVREMVAAQKQGRANGMVSVCSANRFVLEAAMRQASRDRRPLLVEATCNQVNQEGGYTGMTPADFSAWLATVAQQMDFPSEQIILGGDHLGPNPWRQLPADQAMLKARELVSAYVRAGFRKIHLDASMRLGDDPPGQPLDPLVSAQRAASLCVEAEAAAQDQPPVYAIGTEVPVPGGAQEHEDALSVTTPREVSATLTLFQDTFQTQHLKQVWERVIALVVQPGVEFGDQQVFAYDPEQAAPLARWVETVPGIIFEAHSTDYQTARALSDLVRDHFAILKVGPGLTFAFREAVFALACMEEEWLSKRPGVELSRVIKTIEQVMLAEPRNWQAYYHGSKREQAFARKYSFSDRIRYYWPQPEVAAALSRLLANLETYPAPLTLVSQYLPMQYERLRAGEIQNTPRELIWDHIQDTLRPYSAACG